MSEQARALIEKFPPNDGESLADYTARMNVRNNERRDATRYTFSGLATRIGRAGVNELHSILKQHGEGWEVIQLGGGGMDLSHPETQAGIEALPFHRCHQEGSERNRDSDELPVAPSRR